MQRSPASPSQARGKVERRPSPGAESQHSRLAPGAQKPPPTGTNCREVELPRSPLARGLCTCPSHGWTPTSAHRYSRGVLLLGIDPLLGPDLLATLRAMGHGDRLVLADANFPAARCAVGSSLGRPLRLDGSGLLRALQAILSVLPLDEFVPHPLTRMQVVGDPAAIPPIAAAMQQLVDKQVGHPTAIQAVGREQFYQLSATAYAVVATGERAFYANLILQKGVVPPESQPR